MSHTATSVRPASLAGSPTGLRAIATVAGALLAAAAHLVALAAGAEMLVPALDGEGTQQIATVGVAASAAGAALIGWAVAWAAKRFAGKPRPVWLAFALVGLAVSFVPVIAIEATALTKLVLVIEHLLVAAVVIPLFARTLPATA
jgi:hypothetical protein